MTGSPSRPARRRAQCGLLAPQRWLLVPPLGRLLERAGYRDRSWSIGDRLSHGARSQVWSLRVEGEPPLVLKRHRRRGDGTGRAGREAAALRRAQAAAPSVAPPLIAADASARLLVTAAVDGVSLEWVLDAQAGAADAVAAVAMSLARLHSGTWQPEPPPSSGVLAGGAAPPADPFFALCKRAGVRPAADVEAAVRAALAEPGCAPVSALTHGDVCTDNVLVSAGSAVLLDWETAAYRDPLVDLAALLMAFATCRDARRLAPAVVDRALRSYRDVVADLPWGGATFPAALARACLRWVVDGDALVPQDNRGGPDRLAELARRDWAWGATTARQRFLTRLDLFISIADPASEFAGTRAIASELQSRLSVAWGGGALPRSAGNGNGLRPD